MMTLRRSAERGHRNFGWLDTYHTFSFGDYYDPEHIRYRSLRVLNDDRIAPGGGFPTHPHRDMEIITVMLAGRLAHKDSLGSVQEIAAGEVQVMTAGTGIAHSEFNPSSTEAAHLLQIWLTPEQSGLTPRYDQKRPPATSQWQILASPDGRDGSLTIRQDAILARASLEAGATLTYSAGAGRGVWLHVATGSARVNGTSLQAGDAAAIEQEPIQIEGIEPGEVLLIDMK